VDWNSLIKGFKAYLQLERSLSPNSVDAYLRDIKKFVEFLEIKGWSVNALQIEMKHLENFIFWINELGLGERTQARMISGLKAFYKYLLVEDLIDIAPTDLLEGPRLDRKIPEVLSIQEVNAILESIDLSTPHGTRNRAMLETLYASGLRVSELIDLRLTNLYKEIGFIKFLGKNKNALFRSEIMHSSILIFISKVFDAHR
jgi:integrase/recombinase XerD